MHGGWTERLAAIIVMQLSVASVMTGTIGISLAMSTGYQLVSERGKVVRGAPEKEAGKDTREDALKAQKRIKNKERTKRAAEMGKLIREIEEQRRQAGEQLRILIEEQRRLVRGERLRRHLEELRRMEHERLIREVKQHRWLHEEQSRRQFEEQLRRVEHNRLISEIKGPSR
jgi:hypothetical protein